MHRLIVRCLFLLIFSAASTQAFAWEFALNGEAEWRYIYWTRTGTNDIFGPMDGDVYLGINHLKTFPTTSTSNRGSGLFGVLAGENRYGADMSRNDFRMTLFPRIKVNRAIQISAGVNLTSLGIWSDGEPFDSSANTNVGYINSLYVPVQDRPAATNVPNSYVTLQWLRIDVIAPAFDITMGYRTSKLGMGLWKHESNRASATLAIGVRYGPLRFGLGANYGSDRSDWSLGEATSRNEGLNSMQRREEGRESTPASFGTIDYNSGPMAVELALISYYEPSTQVPDARGAVLAVNQTPTEEVFRYKYSLAAKYFDGTFFFNGEVDWFNRLSFGRGTALDSGLVQENIDGSAWVYGVEVGGLAGPAKITLNYVRATGDDPSTRKTSEDAADSQDGLSSGYMKDWGYLMYYMYGTGDGWDAAGLGQPTNFHHVGARLDYALASNLNVAGVYSFAWRDQPNAYRLGGNYQLGIQPWTNNDILGSQSGTGVGRAVPDHARNIGWEVDLALEWKLLENLTWSSTFALWQPGTWWSHGFPNTAAIYRTGTVPNANPNDAAGEARAVIGSGRHIDPLFAVESKVLITF